MGESLPGKVCNMVGIMVYQSRASKNVIMVSMAQISVLESQSCFKNEMWTQITSLQLCPFLKKIIKEWSQHCPKVQYPSRIVQKCFGKEILGDPRCIYFSALFFRAIRYHTQICVEKKSVGLKHYHHLKLKICKLQFPSTCSIVELHAMIPRTDLLNIILGC